MSNHMEDKHKAIEEGEAQTELPSIIYDYFKKEIERQEKKAAFDTWGDPREAYLYSFFKSKDRELIQIEGDYYFIYTTKGGGAGMGETPPLAVVTLVDPLLCETIKIIRPEIPKED